jgi:hypothetical protein
MWQPLLTAEQLITNCRIRQTLIEGDFQNETVYQVTRIGYFYFIAQVIEQNSIQIPQNQQLIIPYRIQGIAYYGFEIRVE